MDPKERIKALERSLEAEQSGAVTIHGARLMIDSMEKRNKGHATKCKIVGYRHTRVHRVPDVEVEEKVRAVPIILDEGPGFTATVMTDVASYFLTGPRTEHYDIDVSLQFEVDRLSKEIINNAKKGRALFLVTEEKHDIEPMIMGEEQSFQIEDPEMVVGGRSGERALGIIRTADRLWPVCKRLDHEVNWSEPHWLDSHWAEIRMPSGVVELIMLFPSCLQESTL